MTALTAIEGIGDVYMGKLKEAGIDSLESLLEKCTTPAGRTALADSSGISGKLILKWANRADLARVKGIGTQYADLLEVAGVDTVPALARRVPENLLKAMADANDQRKTVNRLPTIGQVEDWVNQAKDLPRVLTY
ncbi:MAG: DUF4332 domain-containing protein [Ardenticatenaceae bacterium]|nr:DUF4332 domain-containing protein [Ardenticatenaceae bacterium]